MIFGGGGVLFLLGHDLRLFLRRTLGTAFLKLFFAGLAIALLVGGYFVARLMGFGHPGATPVAIAVAGANMALFSTLMIAQSLVSVANSVHERADLDLLLSSPLPAWRVLSVRMTSIAMQSAALYLILTGSFSVYLPFFGAWRWLAILPAMLALSLASTAISLFLARYLLQSIGPRRARQVAQILGAFVGAAFFLVLQAGNIATPAQEDAFAEKLRQWLAEAPIDPANPIWLPARAALGDPVSLAVWVGGAILFFAFAVSSFARRYAADAAAALGESPRRRRDSRIGRMSGGLGSVLIRKELRLIARNPGLLGRTLLQFVYLVPIAIPLWRLARDSELAALSAQAFIIVTFLSMLASGLVQIAIFSEDAPDLLGSAPIARATATDAKVVAAGLPAILIAFLIAAMVAIEHPWPGVALAFGASFAIAGSCLIHVWFQKPIGKRGMRPRASGSLVAGFGDLATSLGFAGATALAMAGSVFALIPFLAAIGLMALLQRLSDALATEA